ncbi:serine/threonine protein kinase [Sphingomonas parva]|uniref:Serine/threonine protein kinase n=1 Tax=Sphingomonas parva TaxID=2555898 RepID=A0A4Y8ZNN6_9SPHN|nr:serine/threonine-protein kinase [Sphingomonas parva]TFI57618.1 serine/threonine protein kinase [Sphingomonas parva]
MSEGEDDKTVFRPSGQGEPPAPPPDATIISPRGQTPTPTAVPTPPRSSAGVQVGDVLNHIFEVKRFIARGGMGEVFEGININSDERVAIKVILPALAADPNVTAMFRKEAQTLVRLSHPALVQYRVLAQEPQLGIFYIVTEFIDGVDLSSVLGKISPTQEDLIGLTRRLAEGLRAAHALGAIHRDIAPDNVLLEGGRLERARIVDFGIAKDVDPGSKTIIGDGFAGKLGYVAPEQLGDFGRNVGPWTDVYSLGLVILAVANGRGVDMGASFADAIDRRRKGVDTSVAPPLIRAILARMLVADPSKRFQSMDEVLAAVQRAEASAQASARPRRLPALPNASNMAGRLKDVPRPLLLGGAGAAALLLAGLGWVAFGGDDGRAPPAAPVAGPTAAAPAAPRPASPADVRGALEAALPQVPCTWMTLIRADQGESGVSLGFAGVAGRPADAEAAIFKAVSGTGASVAASDLSAVAPVDTSFCGALDAVRPIRSTAAPRMSISQPSYEIAPFPNGDYEGETGARVVIDFALNGLPGEFALYGIDEDGKGNAIFPSRAAFMSHVETRNIQPLDGHDRYRITIDAQRGTGWGGLLLLTGRGGFDPDLLANSGSPAWQDRFAERAAANGWKAEMIWVKFVDELPN